jgi:uncharacterized protein
VERGPIVMCAEPVDLPGKRSVDLIRVDPAVPPRDRDDAVVVAGELIDPPEPAWPYDSETPARDSPTGSTPVEVPLIPYHRWANRGPSTMRVWLPTTT